MKVEDLACHITEEAAIIKKINNSKNFCRVFLYCTLTKDKLKGFQISKKLMMPHATVWQTLEYLSSCKYLTKMTKGKEVFFLVNDSLNNKKLIELAKEKLGLNK